MYILNILKCGITPGTKLYTGQVFLNRESLIIIKKACKARKSGLRPFNAPPIFVFQNSFCDIYVTQNKKKQSKIAGPLK